MSWILDLQRLVFGFVLGGESPALTALKAALLLLPAAVLIVSLWAMMVSLYTLPFRSGRGYFLTAILMSWWDVGRMAWFYWAGMGRFLFVLVGWIGSLIRAFARLIWNTIKGALELARSPSSTGPRAATSSPVCHGWRSCCCCCGRPSRPPSSRLRCVRP